jgi:hypothetical protein
MYSIALPTSMTPTILDLDNGRLVGIRYPAPGGITLSVIADAIATLTTKVENMDQALQTAIDALRADVTAQTTADASVKALIVGMSQQLTDALAKAAAAGASPEQLQALTDLHAQLAANTADLTTAVTANTPAAAAPAAPTPVPVEVPPVAVPVPVVTDPGAPVAADPAAPVATDPAATPPATPVATDPAASSVDPFTGQVVPPAAG